MLRGVLVAYGIMLAAIPVPLVHFIAVPLSPFVAGFFGGGVAKADEDRIITFGLLVAGLMLVPAVVAIAAVYIADIGGFTRIGLQVFAGAIVPYTWFGVTVGALLGYLGRRKQAR